MSSMLIDETDIKLLLERHRGDIGHKTELADIFAGFTFTMQSLFASYGGLLGIPPNLWRLAFVVFGAMFMIRGIILTIKASRQNYTHEALYEDIINMDRISHKFSIVAIKDGYNQYPNKFLLYYDERWACWFFPNYRTASDESENIKSICSKLSGQLKISPDSIKLEPKAEAIHEKYSVSDSINKVYDHKLYDAAFAEYPAGIRNGHFVIDGTKYAWMSISEMESDPRIIDINQDVVGFVKTYA